MRHDIDSVFDDLFRSFVGADRLQNFFHNPYHNPSFPPYNIVKGNKDEYVIEAALAGYSPEDIDIRLEDQNRLVIESKGAVGFDRAEQAKKEADEEGKYMHRGIAKRSFKLSFKLDEHMQVKGADMNNGMLYVLVKREIPEPTVQRIPVETNGKLLEHVGEN